MTDRDLSDLLTDAVADVEPRHALDDIRARTARRTSRPWLPAGASALAVAAAITAFAVLGDGIGPQRQEPGPAGSPTPSPTSPSSAPTTELPSHATAVYYVGDTPDGPRLYREFRRMRAADPLEAAVGALAQAPLDPDYRTYWPAGSIDAVSFDGTGADGLIQVRLAAASLRDRPADLDGATAQVAVEQVIFTLQAAVGARAPVQFSLDRNPIDQVLGVPTSEPLANGEVLATLAHVSLTSPAEGMLVDNDEPLVVEGAGNSFEGNVVTRVEDLAGAVVVDQQPTIAGWGEDRLFPFEVTLDLSGVEPGEHVVISQTDDPSGQGRFHTDSRRITVVD